MMRSETGHTRRTPWHLGMTIAAVGLAAWVLLLPPGALGATGLTLPRIGGILGLPVPAGTGPVVAVGATGSTTVAVGNPGAVIAVCHVGVGARILGLQIGVSADRVVAFLAAHPRDYAGACRSGDGLLPARDVVCRILLGELEQDLERRVRRAAALEERDGEVQVDVAVEREDERGLAVVAGLEQALDPPGRHGVALALGARGSDKGLSRHHT